MSRRINLADMLDGEELEEATEAPPKPDIFLALEEIADNPENPRGSVDESDEEFSGLVTSIAEIGVTSPVAVCNADGFLKHHPQHRRAIGDARYVLLAGHRRVHAARIAQREQVPGVVDDSGARDPLLWALAENGQRVGLNPLKQAEALYRLTEKPPVGKGLSQGKVAKAIGRSQPYISQLLLLRKLVPELQELIAAGKLTAKDARPFARMPAEEQLSAYRGSLSTPKSGSSATPAAGDGVSGTAVPDTQKVPSPSPREPADEAVQELVSGTAPSGAGSSGTGHNPVMSEVASPAATAVDPAPRAESGDSATQEPAEGGVPSQRDARQAPDIADWHDIPALGKSITQVLDKEETRALIVYLLNAIDE